MSLAWLARAVIGLYAPDYWSPRTPLDYVAVVGTSMALVLTAVGDFAKQNREAFFNNTLRRQAARRPFGAWALQSLAFRR